MHMADWIAKLDDFLRLSDREVLTHAGSISHDLAEEFAHAQYALHEQERRQLAAEQPTGDFDQAVKKLAQEQRKAETPKRPTKPPRKKRSEGEV